VPPYAVKRQASAIKKRIERTRQHLKILLGPRRWLSRAQEEILGGDFTYPTPDESFSNNAGLGPMITVGFLTFTAYQSGQRHLATLRSVTKPFGMDFLALHLHVVFTVIRETFFRPKFAKFTNFSSSTTQIFSTSPEQLWAES
jgi:hypothetical protein